MSNGNQNIPSWDDTEEISNVPSFEETEAISDTEKKNLVESPSQDGSQNLQASQELPSSGVPSEPLQGLGGQSNVPPSISDPLGTAQFKPLGQHKPVKKNQQGEEFVEKDFFQGEFGAALKTIDQVSPFGVGEFVDDIGRAVYSGFKQGQTVDDALLVMTKGGDVSSEDLKNYMDAVEVSQSQPMSEAMFNFNKKIEEKAAKNEDGKAGFWDVFTSLNAGVVPEIVVSSLTAMANPASGAAAAGVVGGTTIASGGTGAIASVPFALAAAGTTLETAATFNELIQDELTLQEKEYTQENVRKLLEDTEKLNSIRARAAGRGLAIGVVDAITGKLGGAVGAKVAKKGFKGAATAGMATTAATESLGGSSGEAVGQVVAGQEINPSEIVLEGIGEVGTAPLQLASAIGADMSVDEASLAMKQERQKVKNAAKLKGNPIYELNGEIVSKEELNTVIESATEEDFEGMTVSVTNDPEMTQKAQNVIRAASIKNQVKKADPNLSEEQANKITQWQLEINSLEDNKTEIAKNRIKQLKGFIAEETAPKKEIKPTETKAGQEKAVPEQKTTPKEGTAPVTEETTPVEQKPKQDAKEQQSGPMREQAQEEGKVEGKRDSDMPKVDQAELQDRKAIQEEKVEFTTSKGEKVSGEKLQKALNQVADDMIELENRIREGDEYASHVSEKTKDENLKKGIELAERVRKGEKMGNMTIAQRINQKLTGETVAILPSQKVEDVSDVLEGGKKTTIGDTDVIYTEEGDVTTIESIKTPEGKRGQGGARKALQEMTAKADNEGKTLQLKVVPEDANTTKEGLVKLYESEGFVMGDNDTMTRAPQTEQTQEVESELTPDQIRSQIEELQSKADEAADNFEVDKVAEFNAQIEELATQLPQEEITQQEFTEEEVSEAMEGRASEQKEQISKEVSDQIEESFKPISIAEYEKYKGKGMYEENKKFLKGLVTEEGSQENIDTRQVPNTEDVQYFDPEDIVSYVDNVASERVEKGFTDKKIPKEKRARRKQPSKRKITADTLREIAKKLEESSPDAKGRVFSDPTMLATLVSAGMKSAAKLIEGGANLLESEIVDHIVEYIRNNPQFKKLSAAQRKTLDIRKYVLDKMGMTYKEYVDSMTKAIKKKEQKAKAEGKKEGRRQEREKRKKAETTIDTEGLLDKKDGKSPKRYTIRTVKALEKLSGKEELEAAIRELGLKQDVVSWKKVQPISAEIVESIFADPTKVDEQANSLYNTITGTKQSEYIENPELSTLHALTFHMMLDRMSNEGMNDMYVKWNDTFQKIGASNGRFTSAMQRDASPYALMNLQIRPLYEGMNKALNTETETGSTRFEEIQKIKELTEQLLKNEELIKKYAKTVDALNKKLEEKGTNQVFEPQSAPKQTFTKKQQIRRKRKDALELIKKGIKQSRGQANIGLPVNEDLIKGLIQLAQTYIEEGIYEASKIKKQIMVNAKDALESDPNVKFDINDALIDISEAMDDYFRSDDFSEARKGAMREAFIENLENIAKSTMGDTRAREKSAETVLLQGLIQKMGELVGKQAKKGSKAYQARLEQALQNLEFSDDVWKTAVQNVKEWLNRQEMDATEKAKILARIEDASSAFMENPFAKSDLRKAVRDGEKDLGVAISDIVKKHYTVQNKTLETLAEKLVSELGLTPKVAKQYEKAIIEEAKAYINEKRLSAIRQQLSLDKSGRPREKADKVNKRVIDRIIEAINLGILDDQLFRGFFAEKYGISELTPENVRAMKNLNDLIHLHEGTDISRRYTKELADYIETLKPWNAVRVLQAIEGITIKGMLTGLGTIFVNIPIGSFYSFVSSTLPSIISNPVAAATFFKEYSRAGLSGTSRRTFLDIMKDGYVPMDDGVGSKFDEREIYGDPIDYMLRNYSPKKSWESISNAKTAKEAAKHFGYFMVNSYAQAYRLANYAKAFDVLLSTRGVEFDMFLKYWQQESKEASNPLRGKFDPTVSKKFIEKVRSKMGYDTELKEQIEAAADQQIAEMKLRGERVGFSFKKNLVREAMMAKRDQLDLERAKENVKSYLLMEQPTGVLSYVYDTVTNNLSIKEDASVPIAAAKLGMRLTLGLFLRISITAAQRGIENIPIAGLATSGIFYDRLPSDPMNPKSEKKWMTFKNEAYDREKMKKRLMTHATVSALTAIVAMNMFKLSEEEEEEEQEDGTFKIVKKTKFVLNPNRVVEVTGFSTEFYKVEQFNRENDPRKDYYFRTKINDKWRNMVPLRLAPHFIFPVSVLGGMADDLKFNPNADRRKRDLIVKGANDFALAWSEMSFATIPKTVKQVYFSSQKSAGEGVLKAGELMLRPARTAIYPNAYRDAYKETLFLLGEQEKLSRGLISPFTNDFPFLEDYMGESTYDVFGYPKKVTSKILQGLEDVPAAGIVVDNYIDNVAKNKERFDSDIWKLKMEKFPNVEIKGYWPSGFDYETKTEASRMYGEILRERLLASKDVIEEMTEEEINILLNGRENYTGARSGGIHSSIVNQVNIQMGFTELRGRQKMEFIQREFIRKQIQGEYNEEEMKKNLEELSKNTKRKKELEELLKPIK